MNKQEVITLLEELKPKYETFFNSLTSIDRAKLVKRWCTILEEVELEDCVIQDRKIPTPIKKFNGLYAIEEVCEPYPYNPNFFSDGTRVPDIDMKDVNEKLEWLKAKEKSWLNVRRK